MHSCHIIFLYSQYVLSCLIILLLILFFHDCINSLDMMLLFMSLLYAYDFLGKYPSLYFFTRCFSHILLSYISQWPILHFLVCIIMACHHILFLFVKIFFYFCSMELFVSVDITSLAFLFPGWAYYSVVIDYSISCLELLIVKVGNYGLVSKFFKNFLKSFRLIFNYCFYNYSDFLLLLI